MQRQHANKKALYQFAKPRPIRTGSHSPVPKAPPTIYLRNAAVCKTGLKRELYILQYIALLQVHTFISF